MTWDEIDWSALDRLRAGFLSSGTATPAEPVAGGAAPGAPSPRALPDYWRSASEVASYDLTFAERIGWKWDAVLAEALERGLRIPDGATVIDWGCGSGVASRRLLSRVEDGRVAEVRLWDRSAIAVRFARERLRESAPGIVVSAPWPADGGGPRPSDLPERAVLVLSHVLGELDERDEEKLVSLAAAAEVVLWVEPGTRAISRRLGGVRRRLLDVHGTHGTNGTDGTHRVVAPCTHPGGCGALAPGRESDWCHFFAPPASAAFHDRRWSEFGRRLGIDLRSLPVSFLALDRGPRPERLVDQRPRPEGLVTASRVLGRARMLKGRSLYLACGADGVEERQLLKRTDRGLHDRLRDAPFTLLIP